MPKSGTTSPTYEELQSANQKLQLIASEQSNKIILLEQQVGWLKNQMFGESSEKSHQSPASLLPLFEQGVEEKEAEKQEVGSYTRTPRGKKKELGDNQDSGLRFDDGIEIVSEDILPDEVKDLSPDEYEIIGEEISDTLGSRTSKNFIHRRRYLKVKLKNSESPAILKQEVSGKIFANSYLALSFIVDMFIDKCLYSIPLHRQHQRLKYEGIYLARSTLISNFIRYAQLLQPLMIPHQQSILLSRILAIDETPMKVGVERKKHKMKRGYIWPVMGDTEQIIYLYHNSRGARFLEQLLEGYCGTILSDGYSAYKSYVNKLVEDGFADAVTHATCWVHARRKFVKLGKQSPYYKTAIGFFAELYQIEEGHKKSKGSERLTRRSSLSLEVVDRYFDWLRSFNGKAIFATNELLRKAVNYSLNREDSMRVFLRDPDLALDTNYLEREIRPIAIGRKNFMFCWSELGAESLCTVQSLIRTCLLQGLNPRVYLTDVIQRIAERNPETDDISDLLPHIWRDEHSENARGCSAVEVQQRSQDT